ncbi:hypothetical protein V6N13_076641 [Hibiscus sabdariffa]
MWPSSSTPFEPSSHHEPNLKLGFESSAAFFLPLGLWGTKMMGAQSGVEAVEVESGLVEGDLGCEGGSTATVTDSVIRCTIRYYC